MDIQKVSLVEYFLVVSERGVTHGSFATKGGAQDWADELNDQDINGKYSVISKTDAPEYQDITSMILKLTASKIKSNKKFCEDADVAIASLQQLLKYF